MRNNHDKKTHKLGKRTIALCLALAVICTCLVPVFATEGLSDPQPEQEVSRSAEGGEDEAAGFGGDEAAGFGGDEAAGFGGDEAAGFGGDEAAGFGGDEAARPVEGDGENPGEGGPTVTDSEWGTVIEYGTDSSTETQWSGEDDVVTKPDDEVVVSGDEIKELQDMVVYRFWLKELNTLDLQDITAQAQINEMTESEYLARYGEVLWNLYFIQAVPRAETIADYSSNIQTPSSNRDPEGTLRLFDYWYTLDEFGNQVRLDLTDPISNILDDKTTTVNVYAAWKDGTVGSDKEESVDHEDLVDKNPVPVDLETKASASYEDEDGNMKSVDLPVEVKNLPSAADHLSVSHMGDKSMQEFYESHLNELGKMAPILGLKISPKNAKGETVQPANGQKATVTVSGLEKLPEMEGATADTLKVFHETSDGNVEILDVLTYTNGTLTFETSSFSPFVVVRTDGYDTKLLDDRAADKDPINLGTINVGDTKSVRGYYSDWYSSKHSWTSSDENVATVSGENGEATITGVGNGTATITHKYYYNDKWDWLNKPGYYYDTWTVTVKDWREKAGLYIMFNPEADPDSNEKTMWTEKVTVSGQEAKLADTNNAIWSNDRNIFDSVDSLDKYIKYWPDGEKYTGDRKLEPGDSFRTQEVAYKKDGVRKTATLENMILDMYKGKLIEMYTKSGVSASDAQTIVNQLEAKDITFTIIAHKISRHNGGDDPDKHIDCTVTVTCDKTFTAKFNVKKPGESGYTTVSSKLYLWKDNGVNTVTQYVNGTTVPPEINKDDGSKWVFDGWYPEDDAGTGPDLKTPIQDDNWPYTVTQDMLTNNGGDRVVNFYAHYKKATSNVTITKTVTGLLGDHHQQFTFQIVDADGNAVPLTKENITVNIDNVNADDQTKVGLINNGTDGKFTLVSGASVTIKNLAGNYKIVEETVTGYETKWQLDAENEVLNSTEASVTMSGTDRTLAFTNHRSIIPDTGVILDTLPYIVILAVVVGGGVMLFLRKRRKDDED